MGEWAQIIAVAVLAVGYVGILMWAIASGVGEDDNY